MALTGRGHELECNTPQARLARLEAKKIKSVLKRITIKARKAYISNPDICPHCKSTDLTGGEIDASFNQAYREVSCNKCNSIWREIFTITDIELIER